MAKQGRRANGEGSKIGQRKDGRFYKAFTVSMADGSSKREFVYGKTKKAVIEKHKTALEEIEKGIVRDAVTLGEFLGRWLHDSVKDTVRQSTWERYERIVRIHLVPTLGKIKIKDLTPSQVQGLYRKKLDEGLSPRTVQYLHRTLHRALKQAVRWSLVPKNVTEAVDPPRPKKKEIKPLTAAQVNTLLDAIDNHRDRSLYLLAVSTGIRQGEILGLRWKDLDLYKGVVRVRRSLSITNEGVAFVPPKSAKGKRSIGLIPAAVEVLKTHRGNMSGGHSRDEELVLATSSGTPIRPQNLVRRSFKPLLRRAGLPEETRFHDLRHTCATLLLVEGVHPKIVQEMLGHSSIVLTLDTYSHFVPSLQEKAVFAMKEALGRTGDFDNISDVNPSVPPTGFEPVPSS